MGSQKGMVDIAVGNRLGQAIPPVGYSLMGRMKKGERPGGKIELAPPSLTENVCEALRVKPSLGQLRQIERINLDIFSYAW